MRVCENGTFKIKNPAKLDPSSLKNLKTGDQIGKFFKFNINKQFLSRLLFTVYNFYLLDCEWYGQIYCHGDVIQVQYTVNNKCYTVKAANFDNDS